VTKKWYDLFVTTDRPEAEVPKGAPPRDAPARPAKKVGAPPKRAADLAPEVPETTFARPVADPNAFGDIYAAAQITTPGHGYSILKVAEMLGSEHLRELPAEVKRKSILVALDAAGATVDSVVEDAVQRDRALDTYQKVLEKSLGQLRAESEAENRNLEAEVERQVAQLKARIDENNQRLRQEEASLSAWRDRKQVEENRIAEAVSYFVTENPISTATPPKP
jgi:hypothetical protein